MKLMKYTFRSPLFGSIYSDELFPNTDYGSFDLSAEGMAAMYDKHGENLMTFLTENIEDLAEYVDAKFRGIVVKACFGDFAIQNGKMYLLTYIYTLDELSDPGIEDIREWISGQMSDGWGESLEQLEWMTERIEKPIIYFDEHSLEFEEDVECFEVYYYCKPWNYDDFYIDLCDYTEEEVDVEGKVVATLNIPGKELQVLKVKNANALLLLLTAYRAEELKRLTNVEDMAENIGPFYLVREFINGEAIFLPRYVYQDGEMTQEAFFVMDEDSCYPMDLHKAIINLLK